MVRMMGLHENGILSRVSTKNTTLMRVRVQISHSSTRAICAIYGAKSIALSKLNVSGQHQEYADMRQASQCIRLRYHTENQYGQMHRYSIFHISTWPK